MNEVKYCEDCKHAVPYAFGSRVLVCRRTPSDEGRPDLVSRSPNTALLRTCVNSRSSLFQSSKCGPSGELFEPKPPRKWWKFWG